MNLEPLFIETGVSLLSGLFLLVWGMLFFSNPLYQLSLFTRVRNSIISPAVVEEELSDIYVIGVDPRAIMSFDTDPERNATYDMLAGGIQALSAYALALEPDEKVIVGIDYVFLQGDENEVGRIVQTLARTPDNLTLIFGMTLEQSPGGLAAFGPEFLTRRITIPAISARNEFLQTVDPGELPRFQIPLDRRILFGHLHLAEGTIRKGFDRSQENVAIGTVPLVTSGSEAHYPSLALMMYLVANTEPGTDLYSDPFGGQIATGGESDYVSGLLTGMGNSGNWKPESYSRFTYLDFRSSRNFSAVPGHFAWLSDIADPDPVSLRAGLESLPYLSISGEGAASQYFFIAPTSKAAYFGETGPQDLVYTLASTTDTRTFEKAPVDGVTAHAQALSNMMHRPPISTRTWPGLILTVLILGGMWFPVWKKSLFHGFAAVVTALGMVLAASFGFFAVFGLFIPVRGALTVIMITFAVISTLRFVITSREV